MMNAKKTAQRLREVREKHGETKRYLARELGCSYNAVCSWEYGIRIPSDDMKIRLANHYGTSVESLFFTDRYHLK